MRQKLFTAKMEHELETKKLQRKLLKLEASLNSNQNSKFLNSPPQSSIQTTITTRKRAATISSIPTTSTTQENDENNDNNNDNVALQSCANRP